MEEGGNGGKKKEMPEHEEGGQKKVDWDDIKPVEFQIDPEAFKENRRIRYHWGGEWECAKELVVFIYTGGQYVDKITKPTVELGDVLHMMQVKLGVRKGCFWSLWTQQFGYRSAINNELNFKIWWQTSLPDDDGLLHLYIQFNPELRVHPNDSPCDSDCGGCVGREEDSDCECIDERNPDIDAEYESPFLDDIPEDLGDLGIDLNQPIEDWAPLQTARPPTPNIDRVDPDEPYFSDSSSGSEDEGELHAGGDEDSSSEEEPFVIKPRVRKTTEEEEEEYIPDLEGEDVDDDGLDRLVEEVVRNIKQDAASARGDEEDQAVASDVHVETRGDEETQATGSGGVQRGERRVLKKKQPLNKFT